MRPILINKKVAKTTFQIDNCTSTENISIELTRVGGNGSTIIYPAFESDQNQVTFMWDDAIYKARKGRYQGIIRIDGCKPFCVPIHVDSCTCSMGRSENGYFTSTECLGCAK
ncbi:hypothetical protein L5B71_03750 [Avibacterium sp. 21-586]|uniref:hypothetical protein n=1 Tax=Avibacterium sp. 21-586 TaxID=2911534 RepID=UPI002247F59E|nr:hypothetical protein [Avibacterium sp. 21-586]MCW9710004.1 hypothetical protein [Avibacterium sp. 21-586]